jgi:hypothetical protein
LSTYQSKSKDLNTSFNDRLERTIKIHTDLVNALQNHGCKNCVQILRDIINQNSGEGRSPVSLLRTSTTDSIHNANSRQGSI